MKQTPKPKTTRIPLPLPPPLTDAEVDAIVAPLMPRFLFELWMDKQKERAAKEQEAATSE